MEGGRGGREVGRKAREGGMTVTHSNSDTTNPLSFPQRYLNSNHVTYYVVTCQSAFDWVYGEQWYVLPPT